jgi:transposase-like protein
MPAVNRKQPKRAKSSDSQYSLVEFMQQYPDDDACLQALWRRRHSSDGEHAYCPKCETERVFRRYHTTQQRQSWNCTGCGRYIYPTAGTIFHKSSTSLHLWFYAMYLMASTRCGISAKQLERELGVTYKTAWRIAHLIRHELMNQDADAPLAGTVEADETYIGGKRRGGATARPAGLTLASANRPSSASPSGKAASSPGRSEIRPARPCCPSSESVCFPALPSTPTSGSPTGELAGSATSMTGSPRREGLRQWGHPHEHHRGILVAGEARNQRGLPCRLR